MTCDVVVAPLLILLLTAPVAASSFVAQVEFEDFYDYSAVYEDGVRIPLGERLAVDHTGEAVLFDGTRIGHRLFKAVYKQRFISDDQREAVQLNRKAIADRFWSKALGVPHQSAPKGFHNTAKSIIMYKQSKMLAVQVGFVRACDVARRRLIVCMC